MGWDYGRARYWKNGRIDRKAECDERFTWKTDAKEISVLKSSMVGSTYYAAVQIKTPEKTEVIGCVTLTSVDGCDIGMKIMEETCGPYQVECPKSILKLLTPTDSEWANEWRKKCWAYHEEKERKKKDKYSLKNLALGTRIDFVAPYDTTAARAGEHVTLEKKVVAWKSVYDRKLGRPVIKEKIGWSDGYYTWPEKYIPNDYRVFTETEIVDKQSRDMIYSGRWSA